MKVILERRLSAVPDAPLSGTGPLTMLCNAAGIVTLRQAAGQVWGLPYGRNHRRDDPALVLVEGRGTCSSKHAFLAELSDEARAPLTLMLGIYKLSGATDPKVRPVLEAHGVDWLPEAHCYLRVDDRRLDFTAPGRDREVELLHEEAIAPAQVAVYKPTLHRPFVADRADALGVSFDALWAIREACVAALAGAAR
ncbi:MAG: hypothetical protein H6739_40605 [Alphaproteobacteria bacterium]|nr:hypothetical protein [Alphaproteobacteria bacterium]